MRVGYTRHPSLYIIKWVQLPLNTVRVILHLSLSTKCSVAFSVLWGSYMYGRQLIPPISQHSADNRGLPACQGSLALGEWLIFPEGPFQVFILSCSQHYLGIIVLHALCISLTLPLSCYTTILRCFVRAALLVQYAAGIPVGTTVYERQMFKYNSNTCSMQWRLNLGR